MSLNFYNENKKQRYKSLTSLSVSVKRGGTTDRYGVMLSKVRCIMECNRMKGRTTTTFTYLSLTTTIYTYKQLPTPT